MDRDEQRDLLIRVDQNVINLVETVKEHVKTDKDQFKAQGDDIEFLKKWMFTCMGGLAVMNLVLKFLIR